MAHQPQQRIIIIGCGRLGAELARSLAQQKHIITVVDATEHSFDRLGPDFIGRTVQGEAIDQDVLLRAGIQEAHAFAAVTSSDSINIVTARVARDVFNVEHVVARIFNPRKAVIYEQLGLQGVASTSWGAQRLEQIILHPGLRAIGSAGNGEVQMYELDVPLAWAEHTIGDLLSADHVIPIALTRGGKAVLPERSLVLQEHDILQVSATGEGVSLLRQRLKTNGD